MSIEDTKRKVKQIEAAMGAKHSLVPASPQPLTRKQEAEINVLMQTEYCQRCKFPLDQFSYGWLRDAETLQAIPCPECSPERIKNRKIHENAQRLARLFGGSNIPKKAIDEKWCFDTLPPGTDPAAIEFMRAFGSGLSFRNVYLVGERGHGKSGLAIAAGHEFIKRDEQVLYLPASEYFEKIRNNLFTKKLNGESIDVVDLAHTARVLIFDDLGVENSTPFVLERLYRLIEVRRNDPDLYTVITSNYSTEVLASRFMFSHLPLNADDQPGFRVAERIDEDFMVIEVKGRKLRKGLDISKFGNNSQKGSN